MHPHIPHATSPIAPMLHVADKWPSDKWPADKWPLDLTGTWPNDKWPLA